MSKKEIPLKVVEALQDDAYKGIARIDADVMRDLEIRRGDAIVIKGNRETIAIADRAYPADVGEGIIRIDGILRRNAKTGIGEPVKISKAEIKEAKKITIAPAQKGIMVQGDPEHLRNGLLGRTVVKGDVVVLGGVQRRKDLMSEEFGEMGDIFGNLNDLFGGMGFGNLGGGISQIKFLVVSVNPNTPVRITENTIVSLSPKAVEISEENVPEINYEDIGGLTEEIKKIREMVEIPIKRPEIFQRLGIQPPKGVLLHGPPGTGKTLLAKAVANESEAYFILLNGPEIMCVSGDTPIFTNPKGYIKAEEIYKENGETESYNNYLVKKLEKPVATYSFKDGVVEKAHITHATKLNAESFKLKLGDGNEIIVSENQPFLIYRNGELVWEPIKNVKKGDFVARLNKINLPEESYDISLDLLKEKLPIIEKNDKYAIKSINLSRSNFIKLPKKTSPELLELFGLIVSDGNISNKEDGIGFYNKNNELIERFKFLMNEVFEINNFKEKNQGDCRGVVFYSKILVKYLEILGFTNDNKENIPAYFFRLPKSEIRAFVRGYFDGDGTVSQLKIKNMVYPTPILYSVKKEFLRDLQSLLLLKLGIQCKIQIHKTKKGVMHKLVVRGNDGRVKFLEIGAISKLKLSKLNQIKEVIRIKEHENIPHPSILIEAIKYNLPYKEYRNKDYYVYKTGNATRHSLNVLYSLAKENNLLNQSIENEFTLLMRDDIGWEKVQSIENFGKKELFDFTVDKDSFTAAPYFLMHNSKFYGESEKKIRDIFEEAEKNAPSIIFIDELDAIAPKREDVGGEVERRVVSQILTMMDGLKSRGQVIVIGATNRVNALDPALRRPGRFDREIEISVPGKEGRLQILKIHSRGMPLKDVKLEELAALTHGFVGADLEALTKEAAMAVLRRHLPKLKIDSDSEDEQIPKEVLEQLIIKHSDFIDALKVVRPSAMREVLVETPNVGWESVGGLDKIRSELLEAVEWPLKNPESFKRMGIRPSRGILLYGPPGTGKTLLAKAVAKESEANFIQVKGPSLLSMWVGKSLPYDEELIVKENGIVKRMKIGDIVEGKLDVQVLAFDRDKRIRFTDIRSRIKHKSGSKLMEVITRTGRKIKVTDDHSLFSFINGKLIDVPTSHLIPNESYIAVPKNMNLPREKIKEINLYENLKNDSEIFVSGVKDYIKRAKKILGLKKTSEILKVSKKYLADIILKDLSLNIINFNNLINEAKLAIDYNDVNLKFKGSKHNYPAIFSIDKDFWRLIGVWVAEGDFNSDTIRIHNQNKEIREDIRRICKNYKFILSETETSTTINSLFLQKVFRTIFKLEEGAKNKRLPELSLILDKESKANLLKGYFSGDGSIYAAERGKFKIEASTISKELANDLLYLLLDFGIVATCYTKISKISGKKNYRISILGVKNFESFKDIGFIDNERNKKIKQYIESRKWMRTDLIPLSGELYELASNSQSVYATNQAIGKEALKNMLVLVDKDKTKYKEYWDLAEGDIYLDLVKEIRTIEPEDYVYDISVPGEENFVAGFGGIIAHNSEEGIRKIFERARQVAPCIVFFDEIDAMAGKRGVEQGTRVTERVLNQLLAEMDGLEDLNDVLIIGATNRPDMLDPALLRPGRFDKILLVNSPNEEGRLNVLKIHTKKMPIGDKKLFNDKEKEKFLVEFAKRTEGYTGADIEAFTREAAMVSLRKAVDSKLVKKKDFEEALKKVKPSVNKSTIDVYRKMEENFLQSAKAAIPVAGSYLG